MPVNQARHKEEKTVSRSIIKLTGVVLVIAVALYAALFGFDFSDSFRIPGIMDSKDTTGVEGVVQGLDLKGGSVIVLEAATEETPTDEQMDAVSNMMRTRLDELGYTEANISLQGSNQVRVEIPSLDNPTDAAEFLGATAQLEFWNANNEVVLTGADIETASAQYGQVKELGGSENYVELKLTDEGVQKFSAATAAAVSAPAGQNYISIVMDGVVLSSPAVENQITDDTCVISGDFDAERANKLAAQIRAGQLPFGLNKEEVSSVSATLGQDALETSLFAGLIGLILVMLFMIAIYRLPGLLASIALVAYMAIVGIILANFHINLTLPGIAGIILSIGMAVDANVVIFERIKEELRIGKTVRSAVDAGFNRALSAVIDSNVTTIIAAVILMFLGTGTIKGFGTTLLIGVIVSMLSAIFITKFLLKQMVGMNVKNVWYYGVNKKKEVEKDA